MWLYLILAVVLVAGIVGGITTGGIFTIALIPIGVIGLIAAIAYRSMGQAAERGGGGSSRRSDQEPPPLPSSQPSSPAHVPTSPEALSDARRAQQ